MSTGSAHGVSLGVREDFPLAVLRSPSLRAAFAPSAGMVCCSLAHEGEELLGTQKGLARYATTGSTMGIPFLHPWANRLDGFSYAVDGATVSLDPGTMPVRLDEHGLPIHGLLGGSSGWSLRTLEAGDGAARLAARFEYAADERLLAGFPFPHVVDMEAVLAGGELTIRTTVSATGDVPVPVCFGFHPYLRLPDVPREDWRVELPVRRHLILDDRSLPTGSEEEAPAFGGRLGDTVYDDLYAVGDASPRFTLAGGSREVTVRFLAGFGFAQVFAPAGDPVVCFEPMTAPIAALNRPGSYPVLAPGGTYTGAFSVSVRAR